MKLKAVLLILLMLNIRSTCAPNNVSDKRVENVPAYKTTIPEPLFIINV